MKKRYFAILTLFGIILLSSNTLGEVYISEIMFNPQGSDTQNEWIEVYATECVNFSEYKLFEANINHKISPYNKDIFCGVAIITSNPENMLTKYPSTNNNSNLEIYESSFSLSNSGEYVGLIKDEIIYDAVNYSTILANMNVEEGETIEYDFYLQEWFVSNSTIGIIFDSNNNSQENIIENSSINNSDSISFNYTQNNSLNTSILTEYLQNQSNNHNLTPQILNNSNNDNNISNQTSLEEQIPSNSSTFQNLSNIQNVSIDNSSIKTCVANISIIIEQERPYYETGTQIKFKNKIFLDNSTSIKEINYTIEYWIEDLFGETIRSKTKTSNMNEKTFTPKIIQKERIFILKSRIESIACNISKSYDEKILIVINYEYEELKEECDEEPKIKYPTCQICECDKYCSVKKSNDSTSCNIFREIKTFEKNQEIPKTKEYTVLTSSIDTNFNDSKNLSSIEFNQVTGNVVYESSNQTNKNFAIILFVIISVTIAIKTIYTKLRAQKHSKETFSKDIR